MKLVLDTNVFISALISRTSYSARIVDAARGNRVILLVCKAQLVEIGRVLHKPKIARHHHWHDERISLYVRKLRAMTEPVLLPGKAILESDATDSFVLDCAEAGNANAIVTNDDHLLALGSYRGIPIITPQHCVELLKL